MMSWSRALISLLALVLSLAYAVPSFYPRLSALQLTTTSPSLLAKAFQEAGQVLESNNIKLHSVTRAPKQGARKAELVFESAADRQHAINLLKADLGSSVSLTLATHSTAPAWSSAIGARPIGLGLDLQGGVMFLLEVDTQSAMRSQIDGTAISWIAEMATKGLDIPISYGPVYSDQEAVGLDDPYAYRFVFASEKEASLGLSWMSKQVSPNIYSFSQSGAKLVIEPTDAYIVESQKQAVDQNLLALRNRINELGISEPLVQRQGSSHILIQLPGVQDPAQAKKIIGATATVSFYLAALPSTSPGQSISYPLAKGGTADLLRLPIASGAEITGASARFDQNGQPAVSVSLNAAAGRRMGEATRKNIGRPMGVLYSESRLVQEYYYDKDKKVQTREVPKNVSRIISLANIQGAFSNQFQITGVGTLSEASELALLLRAGSLSAPIHFVQEQVIGPTLGADNVQKGLLAAISGFLLVLLFALAFYRGFGLAAALGLVLNLLMVVSIMSLLGASLTLAGIAGLVLNIGMAIDANVLNFSRIREELSRSKPLGTSLESGFKGSFSAIFDSNLTTILVALTLYSISSGSVKGFAVTLAVGIITSMFSALVFVRTLLEMMVRVSGQARRTPSSWLFRS